MSEGTEIQPDAEAKSNIFDDNIRMWVNPDAITRGKPQPSGRYLHYFRSWHSFVLQMDDYTFTRWASSHSTWRMHEIEPDPHLGSAKKKMKEGGETFETWSSLTKEEKRAYENEPLTHVVPEKLQEGYTLEGWGQLEGDIGRRTIVCFSAQRNPHAQRERAKDDHYYYCSFHRVRVLITSSDADDSEKLGTMFMVPHDDEYLRPHEKTGHDEVYLHVAMRPEKLKALAMEACAQPLRPRLTLDVSALLFEDEVDRALGELYMSKEYMFLEGDFPNAILKRITFDMQQLGHPAASPTPPVIEEDNGLKPPLAPSEPPAQQIIMTPAPQVTVEAPQVTVSGPAIPDAILANLKHLQGVKYAVWGLAAAMLIAAFIR